ncbi:MAG: peptide-methionine (S)-S-oxide reductase [Glaciecola sp.]|jgi:peptide-methionine (S)-S-oxide reductase
MRQLSVLAITLLATVFSSCQGDPESSSTPAQGLDTEAKVVQSTATPHAMTLPEESVKPALEIATLGAGCYWCVEAVYEQLDGVQNVTSGFMGGQDDNVTYRQVCSGTTGHAEVVQVTFDPKVLPYEDLLDWFWRLHDPTTLNRQGADVGTQYRSVIFFHTAEQERIARLSKDTLGERATFEDPVVTEISAASKLIGAPGDHQDYYRANRSAGYCQMVIAPKLRKLGLEE